MQKMFHLSASSLLNISITLRLGFNLMDINSNLSVVLSIIKPQFRSDLIPQPLMQYALRHSYDCFLRIAKGILKMQLMVITLSSI